MKYEWLNKDSREFLDRGYILNQTPEERVRDIAESAEKILKIKGFADKFEDYMSRGWYSLSSPVWANFGNDRGLGISCFGTEYQDETSDILRGVSEIGMMTKMGGGTAGYFGNLRPRGSEIKNNGTSNGSVMFMKMYDTMMNVISQGSTRRGNYAAYLPIDHGDIHEFLRIREEGHSIQDLSFAVTIPEGWMQDMIDGDKEKRQIWAKVLKKRSETGYPYLFFSDNVNKSKPQAYKDKGLEIKTSQLCVSGDQRVPTQFGMKLVKDLYHKGDSLILTDGHKKVNSSPMKLIYSNAPTYKITLENGMTHTVTADHEVKVYDSNKSKGYKMVQCGDLNKEDKVMVQSKEGLFGPRNMKDEAFLLGLYQSDGTKSDSSVMLDVWENDFDIIEEVEKKYSNLLKKYDYKPRYSTKGESFVDCNTGQSNVKKKRLTSEFLKKELNFKKESVPEWIWESDKDTHWEYIRGLLIADGTVYVSESKGNPIQLNYAGVNIEFLRDLQLLFNNLGLRTSIKVLREGGYTSLPDGSGGHKDYLTKTCYRLIVENKPDCLLIEKYTSVLSRKEVYIEDRTYRDNIKKCYKVQSVEYVGDQEVYCVTVDSDEHLWVCNGVITSNCSEILEYTSDDKSFTCCLSSMNLLHYDDWKDTDAVKTLTYFLDAVLTEFIDKASNIPYFEKAVKFAKEHRSIGLGVLGWHSFLQSKMIPFESMEAKYLNNEIFNHINEQSLEASQELAHMFGEPYILLGYGERFSTRLAIAPTTSSSFILGQISPSIEPLHSNYFVKDLAKGKFVYKNPYLKKVLSTKGKDTPEVWKDILMHGGSVQHLDFLNDNEKGVFKTFGEISQLEIVTQAAQRQKYIDQGQSLNLMIHPDTSVKDINKLIIEAWRKGIKTLYYQRSANVAQEVGRNINNCISCEG